MNTNKSAFTLLIFLLINGLFSCQTTDKIKRTSLNQIILEEEYKKPTVIYLDDISTFEYIPLETTDKSLLDKYYTIRHIDDELIIVTNNSRCEVFFFNREGKFKNSFTCIGEGPNELHKRITGCFWDSRNRELYLNDLSTYNRILVFDEKGKYQRTLPIEKQFKIDNYMADYDKNSFLAYDEKNAYSQDAHIIAEANPFPYILLSKKDGKKTGELPFKISKRVTPNHYQEIDPLRVTSAVTDANPFLKYGDEFIICDIGLDSIYKYSSKTHTAIPLFSKIPELQNQEYPKTVVEITGYNDRYVTFRKFINHYDFETKKWAGKNENFIYDQQKKSFYNAVFKHRIGTNTIARNQGIFPQNVGCSVIPTEKLYENYNNGEIIDPKLKEIASKLKYDDNDVILLIHHKP